MNKKNYVPFEKRSKKEKADFYKQFRGSWNGVNPITRRGADKNRYNRAEFKRGGAVS